MAVEQIEPGQVWVADLYGQEILVRVIAPSSVMPEAWLCQRLKAERGLDTGPYVVLQQKAFRRLENSSHTRG